MIRTAEVGDLEPDWLPPEILLCAEYDVQPNATHGVPDSLGTIPWNVVRLRSRSFSVSPSLIRVSLYRMLIVLPPSMSTRENLTENFGPANRASTTSG